MSSSSTTVTESVVAFLEKIPPFQFLPLPEIRSLARTMTLEYFPKDTGNCGSLSTARCWWGTS